MSKPSKPKAEDRTVDMFTGKTKLDEQKVASEVVEETYKGSETIETAAERWRATAIFTAELFSKHYNDSVPGTDKYRLTIKGEHMFLEKFSLGKDGQAYHWAGLMFDKKNLFEITSVFVRASKDAVNVKR